MSRGPWSEDKPSRRPLGEALERQALESLDRAIRLEELAARARTDAIRLGRLATRYGGTPPLRLLPMAQPEPQHDEAA